MTFKVLHTHTDARFQLSIYAALSQTSEHNAVAPINPPSSRYIDDGSVSFVQKLSVKIKRPFQLQSAIIMSTVPDTVHMHTVGNEYHLKCIPTDSILKL